MRADSNDDTSFDHELPSQELGISLAPDREKVSSPNYDVGENEGLRDVSTVHQGEEDDQPVSLPAEDENYGINQLGYAANEASVDGTYKEPSNSDEDMSIKSEDETESVHYGDDGEHSTINVQPNCDAQFMDQPLDQPMNQLMDPAAVFVRHDGGIERLPWISEAPDEVQTTLNEWFDAHGNEPPPCANHPSPYLWNKSKSGTPAIWRHASGETLEPSMFVMGAFARDGHIPRRRLLVLQGPRKGPYIVSHAGSGPWGGIPPGSYGGNRYRIWLGISSSDADGFEPGKASVWKGFGHNLRQKQTSNGNPFLGGTVLPKATHAQPRVPKGKVGELADDIPELVRSQLEAWMAKHGRAFPPCGSHMPDHLLVRSTAGAPASWWHHSGEQLKPRAYAIDARDQGNTTATPTRVLIVQGPTQGPYAVRYHASSSQTTMAYRRWVEVSRGDSLGFEHGSTVFKLLTRGQPTPEQFKQ